MTENFLQVFKNRSVSELASIADYIEHSKQSILGAQADFEKNLEIVEIDGENVIVNEDYERRSQVHEIFPNFFRLSTFVGLFSYFEGLLSHLCYYIHERRNYKLRVSDLGGEDIIEKSRRYLTLVVGVDLDDLNSEWTRITDLKKIRNCFVHQGSNIWTDRQAKLDKQKLFAVVKKYSLLEVTEYGIVFINDDQFLLNFVKLLQQYLSGLIDKADPVFRLE